jgi:hypothetical protein
LQGGLIRAPMDIMGVGSSSPQHLHGIRP